jgi:two-component sensor histidine kinase
VKAALLADKKCSKVENLGAPSHLTVSPDATSKRLAFAGSNSMTVVKNNLTSIAPLRTPLPPVARRFALDALAAGLVTATAVIARIAIEQVVGGVAPFILTFPAVMVATLLRGGRAGTIAAFSCQLLTIRYVFPHWVSPHGDISSDLANVVLSTVALAGTVWVTASHRQTSILGRSLCERRAGKLELLMAEMNHRTKNNFQVAANLLAYQAMRTFDLELAVELDKAAGRLETIAAVYEDISIPNTMDSRVDLAEHLEKIVRRLRVGATPDRILLNLRAPRAEVPTETAIIVGLIVNEWVANALKHAFGSRLGQIMIEIKEHQGQIRVIVQDDGDTNELSGATGQGSDLVASLADIINADLSIEQRNGRRCTLTIPQ